MQLWIVSCMDAACVCLTFLMHVLTLNACCAAPKAATGAVFNISVDASGGAQLNPAMLFEHSNSPIHRINHLHRQISAAGVRAILIHCCNSQVSHLTNLFFAHCACDCIIITKACAYACSLDKYVRVAFLESLHMLIWWPGIARQLYVTEFVTCRLWYAAARFVCHRKGRRTESPPGLSAHRLRPAVNGVLTFTCRQLRLCIATEKGCLIAEAAA